MRHLCTLYTSIKEKAQFHKKIVDEQCNQNICIWCIITTTCTWLHFQSLHKCPSFLGEETQNKKKILCKTHTHYHLLTTDQELSMQSMNQVRLLYFNELNTAIDENKTSKHFEKMWSILKADWMKKIYVYI